jgi:hypothetical protein
VETKVVKIFIRTCHFFQIKINYPRVVLNDLSNHAIGINLNYFMDDNGYMNPTRSTKDALKVMGMKAGMKKT